MRAHYDFAKMKGHRNPYLEHPKQPVTIRLAENAVADSKTMAESAVNMGVSSPDNEGFRIIPSVLANKEVDALLSAINTSDVTRTRAGARFMLCLPSVKALALDHRILALVSDALGGPAHPFRATLFEKTGAANWSVSWHQDRTLPLRERRETPGWGPWSVKAGILHAHAPAAALAKVVALRIHLDDSTPDNGPLRLLPGTHRLGILSDRRIRELADAMTPVICCVARGGIVRMSPLLVHASSKAITAAKRRVIHIEYTNALACANGLEIVVA